MAHKHITSFRVVDKDGVDKPGAIGKNIVLASGGNLAVSYDEGIVFSAGIGRGEDDPAYRQKFNDIVSGVTPFSGAPYWISSLNTRRTDDGAFFLGVDRCYHAGEFGTYYPLAEDSDHQLTVIDTCAACTDCPEYKTLYDNIDIVQTALDGQKALVVQPSGMLDRYYKTVNHWNYAVLLKSWRYNAEAQGNELYASCKYTNHTNQAIPAGLHMRIDFDDGPDDLRAFVIDTAVLGYSRDDLITWEGGEDESQSSDSEQPRAAVYLETTAALPPGAGIRFYAGAVSPSYVGKETRVQVRFRLTGSATGDYDTSYNTNKMVVIRGNWT
jgi:hypothetical protein